MAANEKAGVGHPQPVVQKWFMDVLWGVIAILPIIFKVNAIVILNGSMGFIGHAIGSIYCDTSQSESLNVTDIPP